jgi:hypothetical protein
VTVSAGLACKATTAGRSKFLGKHPDDDRPMLARLAREATARLQCGMLGGDRRILKIARHPNEFHALFH